MVQHASHFQWAPGDGVRERESLETDQDQDR